MLKIGIAEEIITPPRGIGLAGYFNRRPNRGFLDNLHARAIAFELNGVRAGIISLDLEGLGEERCRAILERLPKFGVDFVDNIIVTVTHTHTGPVPFDKEVPELSRLYQEELHDKAAMAMRRAVLDLAPAELEFASARNNPYARCRRYWMKNGTVVTNPGKYNPNIDRPESDFDNTVSVIAVKQEGRLSALLTNIANHGDSTNGDIVSADWHGRMERYIRHKLNCGLPVFALIDAAGDLNQVNNFDDVDPCCVEEATRIGQGYARIVLGLLDKLEPLELKSLKINNSFVDIPHRKISPEELAKAKKTLAEIPETAGVGNLTSEGLANGDPVVLRYFAKRIVDCAEKSTPSHRVRLTSIEFDRELAFISLPGEPFNGVSRGIRAKSPFKRNIIIEQSQGRGGYFAMPECFPRGGYETMPGVDSPAPETATVLIEGALANLGK